jgi:hypothetical protein
LVRPLQERLPATIEAAKIKYAEVLERHLVNQ